MGELFEQFVGLEIIRFCRIHIPPARLRFWRDPDGPEVDWVLEHEGRFIPIEVKRTNRPAERDTTHLKVFMEEYKAAKGILVCTSPTAIRLSKTVLAVPWQDLPAAILEEL